jgi:hypothetical protein
MLFYLLKDSNEPLWDECTNHSKLLVIAKVFTIKLNYRSSKVNYDTIIEWMKIILPEGMSLFLPSNASKFITYTIISLKRIIQELIGYPYYKSNLGVVFRLFKMATVN